MHWTWTGNSFHTWYFTCFSAILPNLPTLSLSHRVHYPLCCLQWIRQLEPVAPGGRDRSWRWCLAFLCFQSSSWWKASRVSTSKENPEPRVMYWFRVPACFEKLTLLSFGRSSVLGSVPLHHVIFRTSALSSFLPKSYRHHVPDSAPSDSNSVP